jgi:hypothetical protein
MAIVRLSEANARLQALGGYTDETSGVSSFQDRLFVSRLDTSSVVLARLPFDTTAWTGVVPAPSTQLASGPDPTVRRCLDGLVPCDRTTPWRSVSKGGRTYTVHISYEGGYRRSCGIRGAIVCTTHIARGYQRSPLDLVDTIRVAP